VLGIIALRGHSTAYQIERAVGRTVGNFWPFPHAQLYREPLRLEEAGLLSAEQEETGRRRRIFALTEEGREALRRWLRQPTVEAMEVRDLAELQLFFSEVVDEEDVAALARAQVAAHRRFLERIEAIAVRQAHRPFTDRRMAPLDLGIRLHRVALEFWQEWAERYAERTP
jgi:DNA-binding PadR family transcriptional regulator